MGPPKKDAFADIFQSAASNSSSQTRNMNMADLQKLKSNNNSGSNVNSRPMNSQSNWNDLDIFSSSLNPQTTSSSSLNGSGTSTSVNRSNTNVDDPFSIFDVSSNNQQGSEPIQNHGQNHGQNHRQNHQQSSTSQPPKPKQNTSNNFQGSLLDDDEFTDAFIPQQTSEITANDESSDDSVTDDNFGYTQMQDETPNVGSSSDSRKDEVLAQLVDIGFPVDVSNNAISEVGLDVQACVNFIMSGGKSKKPSQSSTRSQSQSPSVRNDDFGAMMNDFSSDFFNKASLFFNKSKETVRQNIEQFQQSQARERSGSPSDQLPMWMRNQEQYKHDAIERKNNGDKYEDYGSDEDNIDGDAIAKFMEEQKQRDKEKNQARIQKFKSMARERMNGSVPPNNSDPTQLPPRPTSEPQRTKQQSQGRSRESPMRYERNQQPKQPSRSPQKTPISEPEPEPEVDLLGLGGGLSRAERFKSGTGDNNGGYVSSRRRRTTPKPSVARKTTREPLNQFQQSDYETGKETATSSFEKGDYDNALVNYNKCLASLPEKHEWRIIINSNLAITLIKVGDYKLAKDHCQQGLDLISQEEINDPEYIINDKSIKFWYIKLLSRKAEALEMKENFPESLECYNELVTKFGVNDKKVMDSRRRVNNVVNPPPKAPPKVQSKPKVNSTIQQDNENTKRIKEYNKKQNEKDELKSQLQEKVQQKIFAWSNGKEDNIRALLMSLPEILPSSLGFPFLTTKKITINDLMLPKKVKINYMKVISAIHPDKLSSLNLEVENEMLCQSVFITLNKSWDTFKDQNGLN